MSAYLMPAVCKPAKVRKKEVLLVASGDLRQSANEKCWPAQAAMEDRLTAAVNGMGYQLVRAHPAPVGHDAVRGTGLPTLLADLGRRADRFDVEDLAAADSLLATALPKDEPVAGKERYVLVEVQPDVPPLAGPDGRAAQHAHADSLLARADVREVRAAS